MDDLLPYGSKLVKILYVIKVENHDLSLGPALGIVLRLGLELGSLLGDTVRVSSGDKLGTSLGPALGIVLRLGFGDKTKLGLPLDLALGIVLRLGLELGLLLGDTAGVSSADNHGTSLGPVAEN